MDHPGFTLSNFMQKTTDIQKANTVHMANRHVMVFTIGPRRLKL